MSIGAIVPISTRFWLSFSDWRDNASDSCCAFRLLMEYERSQYAFLTFRSVCVMMLSSWMSDRSRTFLLTATCCRIESIWKLRSSGCVNCRFRFELSCGLKLLNRFVVVNRELFQLAV